MASDEVFCSIVFADGQYQLFPFAGSMPRRFALNGETFVVVDEQPFNGFYDLMLWSDQPDLITIRINMFNQDTVERLQRVSRGTPGVSWHGYILQLGPEGRRLDEANSQLQDFGNLMVYTGDLDGVAVGFSARGAVAASIIRILG